VGNEKEGEEVMDEKGERQKGKGKEG